MRIILIFGLVFSITTFGQKKYMVDCDWSDQKPARTEKPELAPNFPGGKDSLKAFTDDHLYIPKDQNGNPIEGQVQIALIVTKFGELRNPYVLKSTNQRLERYALAFIKHMPDWVPGENAGEKVCATRIIVLNFKA